jgi:uncharacterized protein YjbI with pentapeptide repeats
MKTTIQIKTIFGKLLFEFEKENNTIKDTVEEAVKRNISLIDASLNGASLNDASLNYASLNGASLIGASLIGASLIGASLIGASLIGASLNGASLNRASLNYASLNYASLNYASLNDASLIGASLNGASLNRASLNYASLNDASLIDASLNGASLNGASLNDASLNRASLNGAYSQNCIVPEGELIVYKKLQNNSIAKLLIPIEAKRVNGIGSRKCRFEYAKVLEVKNSKNRKVKTGNGIYQKDLIYKVNEIVYPDSFDPSPLIECSHGIHAFITKTEAENYD